MLLKKRIYLVIICIVLVFALLTTAYAVGKTNSAPIQLTQKSLSGFECGETLNAEITAENHSDEPVSGQVILVLFDRDSKSMCTFSQEAVHLDANSSQTVTLQLKVPKKGNFLLKAFVWDNLDAMNLLSDILVLQTDLPKAGTVTLSIERRTIGKGDILSPVKVPISNSDTAWSVLQREMDRRNIRYSAGSTGEKGGIYLSSIQGDGEFSHGSGSGWMYYVNSQCPEESLSGYTLQDGDTLRVRYTTNLGKDLEGPLADYLQSLIADTERKLAANYNKYTLDSQQAVRSALDSARKTAGDKHYHSSATEQELAVSRQIAAVNAAVSRLQKASYPAASVPEDFANDLWLPFDFKEMQVGQKVDFYPRRIPQIITNPVKNDVVRPEFQFEIVSGNSISLSSHSGNDKTVITAVRPGVSVVRVTYKAIDVAGTHYGACSKINEAYAVVAVSDSNPADTGITITPNTEILPGVPLTSYDTIYYTDGDVVPYRFTPTINHADSVEVTCNGKTVQGQDGTYILSLENRSNIIGVTMKNRNGVRSYYQVIDARKIEIHIANKTNPGSPLKVGDTAVVSFSGITNPVGKLAGIYNPTWHNYWSGTNGTFVEYSQKQLSEETLKGVCEQWNLDTVNSFEVACSKAGSYSFTGGRIFSSWWGEPLGADKNIVGIPGQNNGAPMYHRCFCRLPDFTITVS